VTVSDEHGHPTSLPGVDRLLSKASGFDPGSESAARLWFGTFLEDTCEQFGLRGALLFISGSRGLETVARHGVDPATVGAIVGEIRAIPALAEPAASESEPGKGAPGVAGVFNFHFNGTVATVFKAGVGAAQCLLAAFISNFDPPAELAEVLCVVTVHLARLCSAVRMNEQLAEAAETVARMERELKEMQVCSLNIMEDLQRKNRDLAMLNKLCREIADGTTRPELARSAAEAISSAFDDACVSIYVLDPSTSSMVPYHTTGSLIGDADDLAIRADSPIAADLRRGAEVALDATADVTLFPLARAVGAKSGLLVPLRAKDSTLGFLAVCETRWHRVFSDDERANLRILAGTLSVAIENANLMARGASQLEEMNALTEYIETVVDSVDLAVLVVGADLKIGMINKGFERVFRRPREQFIGRHMFEAFPHLVEQGFENIVRNVLDGKSFERCNWRRKVLGGGEAVQNFRVFPHRAAGGNIVGGIVIIEDVTAKADLEEQLARSEARFRGLVENLADGYLIVTAGSIVYANKAVCRMTGLTQEEMRGLPLSDVLSEAEVVKQCLGAGAAGVEARLIHATGTWVPVEVAAEPCVSAGDQSVSVAIRDVTERKKFERQLEQKNHEMRGRNEQITRLNIELEEAVNKLKDSQEHLIESERLAAITETSVAANHEINNPLFSILGQAQLLLRKYGEADEDTASRLKTIEESALRIACVTRKLANLAQPVVKEYAGLDTSMIDVDRSTTR